MTKKVFWDGFKDFTSIEKFQKMADFCEYSPQLFLLTLNSKSYILDLHAIKQIIKFQSDKKLHFFVK